LSPRAGVIASTTGSASGAHLRRDQLGLAIAIQVGHDGHGGGLVVSDGLQLIEGKGQNVNMRLLIEYEFISAVTQQIRRQQERGCDANRGGYR